MSFSKKTWSDGDAVHATDLNRLQNGVQEAITASGGITTDDALEAVEDAGYIKGIATLTINGQTFDGTVDKTVTISGSGTGGSSYDDTQVRGQISALQTGKQDKLTAGTGISIAADGTISVNLSVAEEASF